MAFQVSPGVNVSEIDLTTSIPAVSVSTGAIAGAFKWGPADKITSISSEVELVSVFGAPDSNTSDVFFTSASFLSYSNDLLVVRAVNTEGFTNPQPTVNTTLTAVAASKTNANVYAANAHVLVQNDDVYFSTIYQTGAEANVAFVSKYAGAKGNSLKISLCPSEEAFVGYDSAFLIPSLGSANGSATVTLSANVVSSSLDPNLRIYEGDVIGINEVHYEVESVNASGLELTLNTIPVVAFDNAEISKIITGSAWEYAEIFDAAPTTSPYVANKGGLNDELHIVVVDEDGLFTGTPGTVLEKFANLSKASDAKTDDGSSNYYKEVLYKKSKYVYWGNHPASVAGFSSANWGDEALGTVFGAGASTSSFEQSFVRGQDGVVGSDDIIRAYDLYANPEVVDLSLLLTAGYNATVQGNVIDLAESRKDCVVFVSPSLDATLDSEDPAAAIVAYRQNDLNKTSSYAVMDSGWKYMYDKYADKYRWVPLNGDMAGLCARTDDQRDPWFSPAGLQRGVVKNVVKLAFNPNKTDRDTLYKAGVNPVVSFPGEGTVLFGDKTMLARPSAFDRINVRRLFIVLEKTIARAARSSLFEFNDEFTRAQFVNLVEPFLRTVKGRRGIYDFRVVCDDTNNTAEIIDSNQFVGDIYIKPARSINFIQLNFVAVRTGVAFDEVVGKF